MTCAHPQHVTHEVYDQGLWSSDISERFRVDITCEDCGCLIDQVYEWRPIQ